MEYTKDQHIIDLQARNTALVEENRRLRAALENYVSYDHDWFNLSFDDLKQAREALGEKR